MYVVLLILVLFLCLQNSADSGELTLTICNVVHSIARVFEQELEITDYYFLVRKGGHFVAFTILSMSGCLAVMCCTRSLGVGMCISMALNLSIATFAEYAQLYAVGRVFTIRDALINLLGAMLGIILGLVIDAVRIARVADKENPA